MGSRTFKGTVISVWRSSIDGRVSQIEVRDRSGDTSFISFGRYVSSIEKKFMESVHIGFAGTFQVLSEFGSYKLVDYRQR